MRVNRAIPLLVVSITILVSVGFVISSVRAGSDSRPVRANTAAMPMSDEVHALHGGFWRTDGGFVSTIRIKNVLVVAPIEVSPTIFMADGTPYPLAPVTVPISGVATVNINDALADAPRAVAPHVSEFGSLSLIYKYPTPGHLVATLAAIDAPRSLSFVYMINEPMPMSEDNSSKVLEGLWWKHDGGVHGTISLSNTTDQRRTATLRFSRTGRNNEPREAALDDSDARQIELAPHTTQVVALEQLSREASDEDNQAGGIHVEYKGPHGAVMVTGSLANENKGYSANIPFWSHDPSNSAPRKIELASAGIMVGKPDPMMMPGFPADAKFIPYVALRNTTAKRLDVAMRLNYTIGSAPPVNRSLPTQHLRPFQSKEVDLQPLLHASGLKSFDGTINLEISYTGQAGDLILANGSVDQTGTYVFEVRPQGIGESIGTITGYWSAADGNDAMFSIWNPTDAPQEIVATMYFGDGSGKYRLPIHLAPQASTMLDVATLIREKIRDIDGNILPSNIREGSASFDSGAHDSMAYDGKKRVTVVIAGGLFNTANATCGMTCTYCNGYSSWGIVPSSLAGPVGWSTTATAHATDSYGTNQVMSGGSWSSDNSGVMSVNSSGGVNAVSPGQATISDFFSNAIVYQGNFCVSDNMPASCPQSNVTPAAQGTTKVTVTIGATASVVPPASIPKSGGTATITACVTVGSAPSSYTAQTFTITTSAPQNPGNISLVQGATAKNWTTGNIPAGNSECASGADIYQIEVTTNNTNTGTLTYQVFGQDSATVTFKPATAQVKVQ